MLQQVFSIVKPLLPVNDTGNSFETHLPLYSVTIASAFIGNIVTEVMVGDFCVGGFLNLVCLIGICGTLGAVQATLKLLLKPQALKRFGYSANSIASRGALEANNLREVSTSIINWEKKVSMNQAIFRKTEKGSHCCCASEFSAEAFPNVEDPLSVKLHANRFWLANFEGGIIDCNFVKSFNSILFWTLLFRGIITALLGSGCAYLFNIFVEGYVPSKYAIAYITSKALLPLVIVIRFWCNTVLLTPSTSQKPGDLELNLRRAESLENDINGVRRQMTTSDSQENQANADDEVVGHHIHSDHNVFKSRRWRKSSSSPYCRPLENGAFTENVPCKIDHIRIFRQEAKDGLSENVEIAAYCESAYRMIQGFTHYESDRKWLKKFDMIIGNFLCMICGACLFVAYIFYVTKLLYSGLQPDDEEVFPKKLAGWPIVEFVFVILKFVLVGWAPAQAWYAPTSKGEIQVMMDGVTYSMDQRQAQEGVLRKVTWKDIEIRTASVVPYPQQDIAKMTIKKGRVLKLPSFLLVDEKFDKILTMSKEKKDQVWYQGIYNHIVNRSSRPKITERNTGFKIFMCLNSISPKTSDESTDTSDHKGKGKELQEGADVFVPANVGTSQKGIDSDKGKDKDTTELKESQEYDSIIGDDSSNTAFVGTSQKGIDSAKGDGDALYVGLQDLPSTHPLFGKNKQYHTDLPVKILKWRTLIIRYCRINEGEQGPEIEVVSVHARDNHEELHWFKFAEGHFDVICQGNTNENSQAAIIEDATVLQNDPKSSQDTKINPPDVDFQEQPRDLEEFIKRSFKVNHRLKPKTDLNNTLSCHYSAKELLCLLDDY